MKVHRLLKSVVPPIVVDWRRRVLGRAARYWGRPTDWEQAVKMSDGYGHSTILARVALASRAVVSGKARYERDSMLFSDTNYPFAVLATLLRAAAESENRLEVVDYGGSLGSTYHQCREFLRGLGGISWWVVEQPEFVALGRRDFSNAELQFVQGFSDLPELSGNGVMLVCSALQYMESPLLTLASFDRVRVRHLVFDRTPMSDHTSDRLCIQRVPKSIYEASYPCWILSRQGLLSKLSRCWTLISDFPCAEGTACTDDGMEFEFRGLIMERKS